MKYKMKSVLKLAAVCTVLASSISVAQTASGVVKVAAFNTVKSFTVPSGNRMEIVEVTPFGGFVPTTVSQTVNGQPTFFSDSLYPTWLLTVNGSNYFSDRTWSNAYGSYTQRATIPAIIVGPASLSVTPYNTNMPVLISYKLIPNK